MKLLCRMARRGKTVRDLLEEWKLESPEELERCIGRDVRGPSDNRFRDPTRGAAIPAVFRGGRVFERARAVAEFSTPLPGAADGTRRPPGTGNSRDGQSPRRAFREGAEKSVRSSLLDRPSRTGQRGGAYGPFRFKWDGAEAIQLRASGSK
jgi:hypothetical protein